MRLGKICNFSYGDSLPDLSRIKGRFPVYGSNGIVGWHNAAVTGGPTIIIGRKGSVGKIHYSPNPVFPIDTTYFIEKTKIPCDLRWLYYALCTLGLEDLNRAAAVPGLNREDAYEKELIFPSEPEQKRIAAILDKADRLRRQCRFAQTLSASFLESVFIKMFGDELNDDYPKTDLIKLVTITGGGTPSREIDEYFTGRIPWLTSKDMRGDYIFDTEEHITEEAIKKSATKLVPKGSILIVVKSKVLMHRLPLAVAQVPMCHGQDIKSLQCSTAVNPLFLVYVLKHNSPYLLRIARGANTEGLTLPMLETIQVPNAPLPLQEKFAAIVQKFERIRRQQREATRQAEHLFQTLLHRAFSGNL